MLSSRTFLIFVTWYWANEWIIYLVEILFSCKLDKLFIFSPWRSIYCCLCTVYFYVQIR